MSDRTHIRECGLLSNSLLQTCNTLVRRMGKVIPEDAECQSAYQQWADALQMAMKYPGEPQAREYADATALELNAVLKRHNVFSF